MAIYPYKCGCCGRYVEVWQSISSYSRRPDRPWCCRNEMDRVITVLATISDSIEPFTSHLDGTVITSRSERTQYMRDKGVEFFDDVMKVAAQSRALQEEQERRKRKQDIIDAFHRCEDGYVPPKNQGPIIPVE